MRRRLDALRWPLVVVLGALAPLLAILLAGRTLAWRDTAQLYAPLRGPVVEALRGLRLPAWNPWEGTGQPLLAQGLHCVLHPVSLAVAFLTPSVDALLVALVAAAALGAWLAARTLGASPAAAGLAALAYGLSGYLLGMTANAVFLAGCASGPWVVAGLVGATRHRHGWIGGALAVAALALSGDVGSLVAFTLLGFALAWALAGRRALAWAAGAAALGVGLAAVQLAPSWAHLAETSRGAGLLDPAAPQRWALSPWRLPELLAPGYFTGVPRSYTAPVFAALAGQGLDRFPFAPSIFVGAPVLLLAAAGLRRPGPARWLAGGAVLFLWLALGHYAGSQQLLAGVPVWGVLRYWEKMAGPLTFCLAMGAGLGADALAARAGRERPWMLAAWAGAALALALAALLGPLDAGFSGLAPAVAALARSQLALGLVQAAVALAALAAILGPVGRRWPSATVAALAGLVFAQSLAASPFALHAGDPRVAQIRPPALPAEPPGPRLVSPLGFDFTEGLGGLDAIDRLQAAEARSGRPSTNAAWRLDAFSTYTGLTSVRWEMVLGAGRLFWPLARRLGTTHVVARPPADAAEADALAAATEGATAAGSQDGGALLAWEIPHRPWASFAEAARVVPGLAAAGEALGEEVSAGRPTVIVEAAGPVASGAGRVLAVRRGTESLTVEAESAADGLLVVNDAWAPGWEATVDGRAAEVLPADVLVRAVRWPAGRHRLEMVYRPPGLSLGLAISALSILLAAGVLVVQRRRETHTAG